MIDMFAYIPVLFPVCQGWRLVHEFHSGMLSVAHSTGLMGVMCVLAGRQVCCGAAEMVLVLLLYGTVRLIC